MTSDRGAAAASWTWDDLAGVVDLAAQNGVHIPGSDYNWRHTWIPLTPVAAASHFRGKIPSSWHPQGGSAGGVKLGTHVRVTSGYHAGKQGHVVALEGKNATIEDSGGARRVTSASLLEPTGQPGKAVAAPRAPESPITEAAAKQGMRVNSPGMGPGTIMNVKRGPHSIPGAAVYFDQQARDPTQGSAPHWVPLSGLKHESSPEPKVGEKVSSIRRPARSAAKAAADDTASAMHRLDQISSRLQNHKRPDPGAKASVAALRSHLAQSGFDMGQASRNCRILSSGWGREPRDVTASWLRWSAVSVTRSAAWSTRGARKGKRT